MIYLDHNATTPLAPEVLEAMGPYLTGQFGNPSSYYQLGREARAAVERARGQVAALLGSRPEEIIFTGGGTEADNLALRGVLQAAGSGAGHIITCLTEHHAVLETCGDLQRRGVEVTQLAVDASGRVDPDDLRRAIRPDTALVSVMAANNETGVIQPLDQIAAVTRQAGVPLHTDAVQAAGKIQLDVDGMGVDLLSLSAHKIYGPKGMGALYARAGTPLAAVLTGGHQESQRRAGTENVAGIAGLAAALSRAEAQRKAEGERQAALRDHMESALQKRLEGVHVNGDAAARVPNTSSLSFEAVDGESVILHLDLRGICAATGSACTTGDPEPSHVLLAMGLDPHRAQGAIRLSLGCDTSSEDVDTTVDALVEVVPRLRAISTLS